MKKLDKTLILTLATACLLGGPAWAAEPASGSVKLKLAFEQQLSQVNHRLQNGNQASIQAELLKARQQLEAFKAAKDADALSENKWQLTRQMEQELVLLHLEAAQQFHAGQAYTQALNVLNEADKIQPYLPVTLYFQALNLLQNGKEWEATKKLYEAKRYNSYPASRKMENPIKPYEVLMANPIQLNQQVDEILQSLGKDTGYPITLNFDTSKHENRQLVPGVGASLMARDGSYFNVYLKEIVNEVLDEMGKPYDIQEKYLREQVLKFLVYDDYFIIGVNPENKVERIQIDRAGYSVNVHGKELKIGEPAQNIKDLLGENHAFQRMDNTDSRYPQTWVYNDFGLSFGITPDQRIGLISIWSLE